MVASPGSAGGADWQDAAYARLIAAGALDGRVVHSMAPLERALRLLAERHIPCVQTVWGWTDARASAAVEVSCFEPVAAARKISYVPLSVDLGRFRLVAEPRRDTVVSLGPVSPDLQVEVEGALGLPVVPLPGDEGAPEVMAHAAAALEPTLDPPKLGPGWALRALACGVPVGAFSGSALGASLHDPMQGAVVADGASAALAGRLAAIVRNDSPRCRVARRQLVLARHNRRLTAARYRRIYQTMIQACSRS
jgi:glycosyltransferase involved in cell wall biosynthesis